MPQQVTKDELCHALSHRENLTKAQSARVIQVLAQSVLLYLRTGREVCVPGLGRFESEGETIKFTPTVSLSA